MSLDEECLSMQYLLILEVVCVEIKHLILISKKEKINE